jgi:hypothetical protein
MGYSDEELGNLYETYDGTSEVSVWSAGNVYYHDEIVEYQGRYFQALTKTFAEVPGRSKAGIWREISAEEALGNSFDANLVYEESYQQPSTPETKEPISVQAKTPVQAANKPINKTPVPPKKTVIKQTVAQRQAQAMQTKPSDQMLVNAALKEMVFKKIKGFNSDEHEITKKLILPQSTKDGLLFTWESSHPEYISSKGEVTRPKEGEDVAVNLGLTIRLNEAKATRFFTLWVKAEEKVYTDQECVDMMYEQLDFDHLRGNNQSQKSVKTNLNLISHGLHQTKIYWASSHRLVLDESGALYSARIENTTPVRLYAIIRKGEIERMKSFDLIVIKA